MARCGDSTANERLRRARCALSGESSRGAFIRGTLRLPGTSSAELSRRDHTALITPHLTSFACTRADGAAADELAGRGYHQAAAEPAEEGEEGLAAMEEPPGPLPTEILSQHMSMQHGAVDGADERGGFLEQGNARHRGVQPVYVVPASQLTRATVDAAASGALGSGPFHVAVVGGDLPPGYAGASAGVTWGAMPVTRSASTHQPRVRPLSSCAPVPIATVFPCAAGSPLPGAPPAGRCQNRKTESLPSSERNHARGTRCVLPPALGGSVPPAQHRPDRAQASVPPVRHQAVAI